ncbi:MAG TPA: DNA helicase PcrA [Bacillota bacterium]|nr:DNA helicase PcrA [Bacillota bacterium]
MDFLKGLNPVQKEAVAHPGGPMLILAGAGSGKTRVLTHRIAHLVHEHRVSPYSILAITFTNKAAREMQSRLGALLPGSSDNMWVSTFHSMCVRILRRDVERLGISRNFVVYDASDQQSLIKRCLRDLNIDEARFTPGMMLGRISLAKNNLQSAVEFSSEHHDYFSGKVADVYELYEKALKANSALDFDDLLLYTVRLFAAAPDVLDFYQRKFQHILVDEYQDTNMAQYIIVRELAKRNRNICVVGDDDQSIYAWRGATVRNILEFEKDYPEARVFKLEQNYRSSKNILQAANSVIAKNVSRKDKTLWTENAEGEPIVVFSAASEQEEAYFVAHTIAEDLLSGGRYSFTDCAVLYRMHAQSRAIEEAFMRFDIPYRIIGGHRFYDRREIKDLIAYLRVLLNGDDELSLRRILNVPRRGLGDVSIAYLVSFATGQGISLYQATGKAIQCPGLRAQAINQFTAFHELLERMREKIDTVSLPDLVEHVLESSGLLREATGSDDNDSSSRIENMREFISVAKDFADSSPEADLANFLGSVSLVTQGDDDEAIGAGGRVTLMSLHSAKGLEFPVVFLVGMEEGLFPHSRTLDSADEMEEERRLCYVGLTRAMEKLYITHAHMRMLFGRTSANAPSRFLRELPSGCVSQRGERRETAKTSTWERKTPVVLPKEDRTTGIFAPADRVIHPKFGEGTVVSVSTATGNVQVTVAFLPPHGIRTLALEYAPLKKKE